MFKGLIWTGAPSHDTLEVLPATLAEFATRAGPADTRDAGDTMPNAAVVITWGQAVRGRETQALQVFNEAMAFYGRLQREGEIESFEPVQLEPGGGTLNGFCIVRGEQAKLAQMRASEDFIRLNNRSTLIVENFGVHTGFLGEELQRLFTDWGTQAATINTPAFASGAYQAYTRT